MTLEPRHKDDDTSNEETVEHSEPHSRVSVQAPLIGAGAGACDKTNDANGRVLEEFLPPAAPLPERRAWADGILEHALWRILEIVVVAILVKAVMK
ncbi:hypothetical protein AAF712_007066 [Marasmius tenuissimus]|uniref:Uncharacterized protein n=1 Tax=Marasmius tenuissimus TaxID=585030 RepID=A0ABR2ZXX4_9AGAR